MHCIFFANYLSFRRGLLQPDAARFPSGIKALADYVHSKAGLNNVQKWEY